MVIEYYVQSQREEKNEHASCRAYFAGLGWGLNDFGGDNIPAYFAMPTRNFLSFHSMPSGVSLALGIWSLCILVSLRSGLGFSIRILA
ncbi:hypothetical protein WG66_009220 [Moniliophthora roreri]|nr:hypothetical protein WG66_009220 [Moniliophthora roreri]